MYNSTFCDGFIVENVSGLQIFKLYNFNGNERGTDFNLLGFIIKLLVLTAKF